MDSMKRQARWAASVAAIALAAVVPTACDTLKDPLEVSPASRIPAVPLEVPGNAKLLSDGAVADFECAFGAYVTQGGTVGEEFIYAQQTASRAPYDRRNTTKDDIDYATNACTALGVYTPLQTARYTNENLLALLTQWTDAQVAVGPAPPNRTNLMSIAATYAGFSLTLLGEGFCTMAVSRVNKDLTLSYGGEIQRDSVFKLAVVRFSEAITHATAASNLPMLRASYVGRARAKLNLGDYAGAKADALLVPPGFILNAAADADPVRRQNRVVGENNSINRGLSVGTSYRTLSDPRVPVTATTTVSPTGITHFYQTKYATAATPIPLATYEEAQLIIAEAEIRANTPAGRAAALPILDASRTRGSQGAFAGTTHEAYLAELIDQRRRELFAESHHLGDIIRFNVPVTPVAGTAYHFGGNYGTQICLPLPSAERLNNPLIGG